MKMHKSNKIRAVIGAAVASVLTAMAPVDNASAETLSMLSGYAPTFAWYREIGPRFIELVKEESKGDLDIRYNGPDTVPTFEQFQPVQSGVFDVLFTHPAYHSGTTSVGLAIDAIAVDPVKRREAGVFDYIDKHYQKRGMKLISAPSTGTKGFRFYLREPLKDDALKGRKIRGTVSYHSMIKALGGAPVNMPVSEVYTALQRGTIDGAAWGLTGASDLKFHEVAKYMADPVFGQVGVMIMMNLERWNALKPAQQKAMLEAGRKIELESLAHFDKLQAEEYKTLIGHGVQITKFSDADAKRLEALWSNGVWEVAEQASGDDARGLHNLARKAGMTE